MDSSTIHPEPKTRISGVWSRLPLFWRFQLGGWIAFTFFSFPLKWFMLENVPGSVLVSLYRDGLGFIITLGMREIYRRVYRHGIHPLFTMGIIAGVSLAGGSLLTLFSLIFHTTFDFEEGKVFATSVIFATFYFRTGLCAGWSLLYFGIKLARDGMERELKLARAESKRNSAELRLLRAQMNPHFLYNALNTIIAEVGKQDQHLKALVRSLAEYLRYSLENRNHDRVPLGQEFDAVKGYMEVEKARFRGDLEIEYAIGADARRSMAPGILLQPLVENAVKHGRKTSRRPLRIRLLVSRLMNGNIRVEVSNTGAWVKESNQPIASGVGLENLRQRLALLYPESHHFQILQKDGWVTVQIEFPASP